MREEGQVYFGEAFVVPSDTANLAENIADAVSRPATSTGGSTTWR
jgi:hypothetical protein